ncbi:MAG: UDP-glucuronic acid decarboxylase family protein [Ilumatobacteraceae bacterium]|nr:SDR family oxidoreductase [Actinomycetota bacterium]
MTSLPAGSVVVVAGGAGFIGSHLCDRLLADGYQVVAVDDLSTGDSGNLAHLQGIDGFTFVEGDIVMPSTIEHLNEVADPHSISAVLNFASPASPPAYLQRPLATLAVGSTGTWNLINFAMSCNARFLMASTSEVYGDPLEHPQVETYWGNVNPIGERSVYDEAKRFSEALVASHQRSAGLDARIVRIFNTYGPRMQPDDGRVVTNMVHQSLAGKPLTIYGDGSQTRSFCYVTDEVDGIVRLLQSDVVGPVNIGNPNEFTIRELADVIAEVLGADLSIEYLPLPSDDPKVRQPDISRARDLLGWEPKIELRDGIRQMVESLR